MARKRVESPYTDDQILIMNYQYNPISGEFFKRGTSIRADKPAAFGYRNLYIYQGRVIQAHRAAYLFMTASRPDSNLEVDHINGIRDDNSWDNLRLATRSQNMFNTGKKPNNTSGYKNVEFKNGRWAARLRIPGKSQQLWLGYYDSPELAHAAVIKAREQYHQEFANHGDNNG